MWTKENDTTFPLAMNTDPHLDEDMDLDKNDKSKPNGILILFAVFKGWNCRDLTHDVYI